MGICSSGSASLSVHVQPNIHTDNEIPLNVRFDRFLSPVRDTLKGSNNGDKSFAPPKTRIYVPLIETFALVVKDTMLYT